MSKPVFAPVLPGMADSVTMPGSWPDPRPQTATIAPGDITTASPANTIRFTTIHIGIFTMS